MSQDIFPDINPSTTSGTQLATKLNAFKAALMSCLSGTARPSELLEGGVWLDISEEDSPDFLWHLKIYDGTVDRTLLSLNLATGGVIISGSEDEFNITHISADAVGAILKLTKRRIANSGQVFDGDTIGELEFIGRGNDSSNPVMALIKAVAQDNVTAGASGAYLSFETTPDTSTTRAEHARLKDAKLAVGAGFNPEAVVHAKGATGIKSEKAADDATGAILALRKRRIAGTGATQNADVIAEIDANTTDNATAEATSAVIQAVATEAHTAAAQGTKWLFKVVKATTAVLSSVMEIGEEIKSLVLHSLERLKLNAQDVASTATIAQLNADKALVRITGSTATAIQGINSAAGKTKVIVIHNTMSAQDITISHANGSATAADRFDLPNSRDVKIKPGSSGEFFYDETSTRWKVKSGAGSGGAEPVVSSGTRASPTNITAAGGITASTTDIDTVQFIQGNAAHIEISANPQISAGYQVGQRIRTVGRNDDQMVTFINGNGVVTKDGGNVNVGANKIVSWFWDGTNWIQEF